MNWKMVVMLIGNLAVACGGTSAGDSEVSDTQQDSGLGIECTGASPSFSEKVEPIFAKTCGGAELCHGGLIGIGGKPPPVWPYDSLVNVKASRDTCALHEDLVTPGDLRDSYLMHKLTGIDMCPGTVRMPRFGSELPHADLQTIADWICTGAKDD